MFVDKYAGRKINATNFQTSLLSFLDNGSHYLLGYIPSLISQLQGLYRIVEKLPSFRFYASSLLVVYDGAAPSIGTVKIKIIDFAHSLTNAHILRPLEFDTTAGTSTLTTMGDLADESIVKVPFPPTTKGPDNGYLLGLKTLIKVYQDIWVAGNGQDLVLKGEFGVTK